MTQYENIYKAFLQKIYDIKLANDLNVNTQVATDTMFGYLKSGLVNFNTCEKNLSNRIDPANNTDIFNGDGITKIFTLTVTPLVNSTFDILINNIKANGYTYDNLTNSIIFNVAPSIGTNNVNISWSFLGQFNVDLSDLEQEILAMYMVYEWVSPFVNDILQFKNYLQSNDFKSWSSANLLQAKMGLQRQLKDMSDDLMYRYSYDQADFSDFN